MNKINEQQELLYEILHRKSDEMLACLHREKEAENSITYGLVFFRKTRQKIVPKTGIRVQFVKWLFEDDSFSKVLGWFFEEDQGLEYRPCKVEIIDRGMLKELSIEECLENYRHFVWYNSLSWTDWLFEIQDIAEVIKREFMSGESKEVVGQDLTYLGERVQDIIPYFCMHINEGDFSYEW